MQTRPTSLFCLLLSGRPTGIGVKVAVRPDTEMPYTETYPLWRTLHPTQTAYSWTHVSGAFASRIDMVWAPTCLEQSIQECEYHPSFFSDHQYLLVKYVIGDCISSGPGVWKFNTSLLDDDNYCSLIASFWSFWQVHYTPKAPLSLIGGTRANFTFGK